MIMCKSAPFFRLTHKYMEVLFVTHAEIEEFITQFPIYQYSFIRPEDLTFDENMRVLCKKECPNYGNNWSCPPAVGKISQCKAHCHEYTDVLVFTSVTEVKDMLNTEETLKIKKNHEKLTRIVEDFMRANGLLVYTLTSDRCYACAKCSFPKEKCRHPEQMHQCIESHGIVIADIAETCCMDIYMGENLRLWFTVIFYRQ